MFSLAILIGIYSYLIFTIGLIGVLYKVPILLLTIVLSIFCIVYSKEKIKYIIKLPKKFSTRSILVRLRQGYSLHKLLYLLLFLLTIQAIVNLIGVLGPELGFDALWYHLTLPKLYVLSHSIFHVPGGLLYYSDMPKLTEMLYTASLIFGDEILAKLVHFSFGILTLVAIYKISRNFLNVTFSVLSAVIFYSNLVIGWESITAYNDLSRAFFETMAFLGFLYWWREKKTKWLIESAVMLGLAISVKLLALQSLVIFSVLIVYKYRYNIQNNYKG